MYNREKYQANRESIIKKVVNYQLKQLENDNKKLKIVKMGTEVPGKKRKIKNSTNFEVAAQIHQYW